MTLEGQGFSITPPVRPGPRSDRNIPLPVPLRRGSVHRLRHRGLEKNDWKANGEGERFV